MRAYVLKRRFASFEDILGAIGVTILKSLPAFACGFLYADTNNPVFLLGLFAIYFLNHKKFTEWVEKQRVQP